MPHIVFESPLSVEAIRARFEPMRIDDTDHIHLGAVYTGRDMLLYEAHIKEPELDQHLTFALIPRWRENAPGEYTIQMGTIGHPRPTPAVHRAIKLLADAVIAYHPDARLLNAKVQEDE